VRVPATDSGLRLKRAGHAYCCRQRAQHEGLRGVVRILRVWHRSEGQLRQHGGRRPELAGVGAWNACIVPKPASPKWQGADMCAPAPRLLPARYAGTGYPSYLRFSSSRFCSSLSFFLLSGLPAAGLGS
jgi:hypothetical protein